MDATIRAAEAGDSRQIAGIYSPIVRDTPISFEFEPPDAEEMRRRIENTRATFPWLVCERGGRLLGYAYGSSHRARAAYQWSAEVSVYIHADDRRAGVGQALYTSLFELLRLQGLFNLYAGITLPNPASVGLHERLGFQPVGVYRDIGHKFGAWHDVGWWQLPLRSRNDLPRPLLTFPAVIQTMEGRRAMEAGLAKLKAS